MDSQKVLKGRPAGCSAETALRGTTVSDAGAVRMQDECKITCAPPRLQALGSVGCRPGSAFYPICQALLRNALHVPKY
jgi:hypothetical protein